MGKASRRALIAAGAAAFAAQALPAGATTGNPLILGRDNRAGQPAAFRANRQLSGAVLLSLEGYADAPTPRVENPWEYSDGMGVDISTDGATGLQITTKTGTALSVDGRATFSRSGVATIPAGHANWTVADVGIGEGSFVLATLQADLGEVVLKAAVPHTARGSFTLRLSGPAASDASVAWLILN